MTTRHPSLCISCFHYSGDGTCAAFPDNIPDDILLLGGDHRASVPGDHGITFSLRRNEEAKKNFRDWKQINSI